MLTEATRPLTGDLGSGWHENCRTTLYAAHIMQNRNRAYDASVSPYCAFGRFSISASCSAISTSACSAGEPMRSLAAVLSIMILSLPCGAQTVTNLAASNPDAVYQSFRRTFSETDYWSKRSMTDILKFRRSQGVNRVYLTSCYSAGELLGYDLRGTDNPLTLALADLAFEVLNIEFELQLFPPELWKADLEQYAKQRTMVTAQGAPGEFDSTTRTNSQLERAFKVTLAAKLNAHRVQRPDLPEVTIPWDGCGGNVQRDLKIVTKPAATRIRYINFHYFALCRDQKIDPVRDARCDLWTDYNGATSRLQIGNYKVLVQWADGTTSLRDLDLQSLVGEEFTVLKQ
jgi:hypothetical protein